MLYRESLEILDAIDVVALRQHRYRVFPRSNARHCSAEDRGRSPLDGRENLAAEGGAAASDQVVTAILRGSHHPLDGIEQRECVIDRLARQRWIIDADGDDLHG